MKASFQQAVFFLRIALITCLLLPGFSAESFAQNRDYLFKIERNRDADEIWYTLNQDQHGVIDEEKPLKAFWMMHTEDDRKEELTSIQKKFGYGIKMLSSDVSNEWKFRIAAYKNEDFYLKELSGQNYKVYVSLDDLEVEVEKLFVQFDGGTFLAPTIAYVELSGIDCQSGEEIRRIIQGNK